MADPNMKQLKIKTGVVKRLTKEKYSYEKEVVKQEEHIEKMKADGKDPYDIKKQGEVLDESKDMIPDTKRRLTKGLEDLQKYMEQADELKETEEFQTAVTMCKEAVTALST
ncbi:tubulin-specific chaperone A-like [Mizuhopecten yessoensis]|uniref:Tubulin-specific chaperone A n=1 Tax=Mizuhopecten yessoensis TaxID=6573 RepID=A0A210QZ68_MIZYE|nr:tubulin-specific chaperone A-like [Mizuhopecten yessoensis]OWF54046.1 Tubulin-specific chaperone A [Mizuhopecten yessoensis]